MLYVEVDLNAFKTANGEVDDDKLLRYWRKDVLHWHNTHEIVDLYNEFLNEDVSVRWYQRMEKENKVPAELKRRWVIARLLDIPAVYLGLSASDLASFYSDKIKLPIPTTKAVNLQRYEERLPELWASPYGHLEEMLMRIYALQEALVYGSDRQKEQVTYLLCQYLLLAGNLQRAEGYLTSAIYYCDKAIKIAEEKNYYDLHAKALYVKSRSFCQKWNISHVKGEDHKYLARSVDTITVAKGIAEKNKKFLHSTIFGRVLGEYGLITAYLVQDKENRAEALNSVDIEEDVMKAKNVQPDPYFTRVDLDLHTVHRAETYLALGSPKLALEILPQGDPHAMRRYLKASILEAEAYVMQGKIDMGVEYAIDALNVANEVSSRLHMARIDCLYHDLRQNEKHKRNPDVARLGLELLKAQKPKLFH